MGLRFRSWAQLKPESGPLGFSSLCLPSPTRTLWLTSASFCFLRGMMQRSPRASPAKVVGSVPRPAPSPVPHPYPAVPTPSPSLVPLEFDKFLEERAKAADRLPNLSSPSAEGPPGLPRGTAPRKKTQEKKDEDTLFAL